MQKYPAHLYTVEVLFGDAMLPPSVNSYPDRERADRMIRAWQDAMRKSHGVIFNVKLFHKNAVLSSYTLNTTSLVLPEPDSNGVRHIPARGERRARGARKLAPPTISYAPAGARPRMKI